MTEVTARAEGRYRVRFVKKRKRWTAPATSRECVQGARRHHTGARRGRMEWTLIWRPSRDPEGDGCYEHYEHEPIQPDDHSPRARMDVRAQIRACWEANRHAASWWTSYDIDGATVFADCQVEVIEGPLSEWRCAKCNALVIYIGTPAEGPAWLVCLECLKGRPA